MPSIEEVGALMTSKRLQTVVSFLDGTFEDLEYDMTTTVLEAVEQVASIIQLENYSTFSLFECRRNSKRVLQEGAMDEHLLLDDHR